MWILVLVLAVLDIKSEKFFKFILSVPSSFHWTCLELETTQMISN